MSSSEEGQLSAESSSESTTYDSKRARLPVAKFNANFTVDSQPTCGEEYLALVRREAHGLTKNQSESDDDFFYSNVNNALADTKSTNCLTIEEMEILQDFDSNRGNINPNDREALQAFASQVKSKDYNNAYNHLCELDTRLTGDQVSYLRSLVLPIIHVDEARRLVVIVAHRFGQSDLLSINK